MKYKNKSTDNNNRWKVVIICVVVAISCIFVVKKTVFFDILFNNNYNDSRSELAKLIEVLPDNPETWELPYNKPNFYFPYKDKLYYYDYITNGLYVMNLDCSEKKLINSSVELRYASFYLVYKDEAYFINVEGYHIGNQTKINKKINLVTGEITNLNNDYPFYTILPRYFDDGIVIFANDTRDSFIKYNLNTDSVEFENKHGNDIVFDYIFDYSNGNYYGIVDNYDNNTVSFAVYKNGIFLNNFVTEKYAHSQYGFRNEYLYVDDKALFLTDTANLYKYDFNTQQVTKTEDVDLFSFRMIESNSTDTIFIYNYTDSYIYELDKEKVLLKKLFKAPVEEHEGNDFSYNTIYSSEMFDSNIYDTGTKIIFSVRANNLRYKTKEDRLGKIVIYDKITKNIKTIEKIRRTFFDYENSELYIFIKNNNTYNIEKMLLK